MTHPGETIARWLADRGWSEGQLQRRSGVPQPTINRIITRETKSPRRETLERIARAFGRTVEDLYSPTAKPVKPTKGERADVWIEETRGLTDDQLELVLRIVRELQKTH